MGSNYYNFRMATVGGFNKRDVINYIEKMRNEFYAYKRSVEITVDQLNAKIRELEAMTGESKLTEVPQEVPVSKFEESDRFADINEAASQLKIVAEELCKNLSNFMSKVNTDSCRKETAKEVEDAVEETVVEVAAEKKAEVDPVFSKANSFWFIEDDERTEEKSDAASETEVETKDENTIKSSDCGNSLYDLLGSKSFIC